MLHALHQCGFTTLRSVGPSGMGPLGPSLGREYVSNVNPKLKKKEKRNKIEYK